MSKSQKKTVDADLASINFLVLEKTGIDFQKRMIAFAENDQITEVEVKEFFKKNYPIGDPNDKIIFGMYYDFYLKSVETHDFITKNNEVQYGSYEPESIEESWRSKKSESVLGCLFLEISGRKCRDTWRDKEINDGCLQVSLPVSGFFPGN